MLNQLFKQLELKVDDAIDNLQLLAIEKGDLLDKISKLQHDNNDLRQSQTKLEQNLNSLLHKLNGISDETLLELNKNSVDTSRPIETISA